MKYKYNGQWYDISIKALDGMPIGAIIAYPSNNIPNGWLECNGSTITSANYPELYDLIGGTLPNLKGRVIVGQDTNDTDFNAIGKTGGEKTHTLTIDEMPSHSHSTYSQTETGGFPYRIPQASGYNSDSTSYCNTMNAGGGQPHNNLQPYAVYKWIIKAKQTTPLIASVVNSNSNSTTDTYSCDYVNEALEDVYSTTETKTNKIWTDGKPIYRKVFSGSKNSGWTDLNLSISNLGEIWVNNDSTHFNYKVDGVSYVASQFFNTSTDMARVVLKPQTGSGEMGVYAGTELSNITYYIVVEYTKTTD